MLPLATRFISNFWGLKHPGSQVLKYHRFFSGLSELSWNSLKMQKGESPWVHICTEGWGKAQTQGANSAKFVKQI